MRKFVFGCTLLFAAAGWAQPVLRSTDPVVNGGSYANTIAPGSIFVVFGTNLAGDAVVLAPSLPLQTTLANVSIQFTPVAGGAPIGTLMVYTTKNQIAGLLPSTAAPGDYNVTVTFNNQRSAPGVAHVVARNYGIVSADSSGAGQGQVQNYRTATEWDLNRFAKGALGSFTTSPASPGQVLVLWGTGLGADAASDTTGGTSGDRTASAGVKVVVGSKEITPAYAGRASGLPGTDQINFTLPGDVDTGCSVPVQVRVGDTVSNTVTLAIVTGGRDVCQHPFLSSDALRRLSAGGTVTAGSLLLSKQVLSISAAGMSFDLPTEAVSGSFARYGLGNLNAIPAAAQSTTIGTCTVTRQRGRQSELLTGVLPAKGLDAGPQLTLSGPGAANVAVPKDANNDYTKTLFSGGLPGIPGLPGGGTSTPVISAGTYTITAPGGTEVGAFTTSVTVPTELNWTNKAQINDVNRQQGLAITWSGGSGQVFITGISGTTAGGTQQDPIYDAAVFVCTANASAGNFTVPSSILSQLPAVTFDPTSSTSNGVGLLGLQLNGPAGGGSFMAPLVGGGNVDMANFTYSLGTAKVVNYK